MCQYVHFCIAVAPAQLGARSPELIWVTGPHVGGEAERIAVRFSWLDSVGIDDQTQVFDIDHCG